MVKVSEEMKRAKGVSRRVGTTSWQWGIKPPDDLRTLFPTQWAHRCSLGTTDLRAANGKAVDLEAQWQAKFTEQRRALNPVPVATITSDLGVTLAASIRTRLLQWDDDLRSSPEMAEVWLSFTENVNHAMRAGLRIGTTRAPPAPSPADLEAIAKRSPFDGLTGSQLARLSKANEDADDAAGLHLASRTLSAVVPLADSVARNLGLLVDWKALEARPVLMIIATEADELRNRLTLVARAIATGTTQTTTAPPLYDVKLLESDGHRFTLTGYEYHSGGMPPRIQIVGQTWVMTPLPDEDMKLTGERAVLARART